MMGLLHELAGDLENAKSRYEMALRIKSNEGDYAKALQRIERSFEIRSIISTLVSNSQSTNFVNKSSHKK